MQLLNTNDPKLAVNHIIGSWASGQQSQAKPEPEPEPVDEFEGFAVEQLELSEASDLLIAQQAKLDAHREHQIYSDLKAAERSRLHQRDLLTTAQGAVAKRSKKTS
jgi:hypothetical protein